MDKKAKDNSNRLKSQKIREKFFLMRTVEFLETVETSKLKH